MLAINKTFSQMVYIIRHLPQKFLVMLFQNIIKIFIFVRIFVIRCWAKLKDILHKQNLKIKINE